MAAGAPLGNKNAAKSRLFDDAIRRAIKQRDLKDGDGETLRKIADKLIDMALAADVSAFREMRDTVDGRPSQSIDATVDSSVTVQIVRMGAENDNPPPG